MASAPLPPLLALPIILTLLTVPLGLAYRYSVSKGVHQRLAKFYAFVTETIQLLLAAIGLTNTMAIAHAFWTDRQQPGEQSDTIAASVMVLVVLLGTVSSVYAVDLIEARVQLGRWGHPYQWQCFILTRSLLAAMWYAGKTSNRKVAFTGRPQSHTNKSNDRSECLVLDSLEYLDLAYDRRLIRTTNWVLTKTGGITTRRHSWL